MTRHELEQALLAAAPTSVPLDGNQCVIANALDIDGVDDPQVVLDYFEEGWEYWSGEEANSPPYFYVAGIMDGFDGSLFGEPVHGLAEYADGYRLGTRCRLLRKKTQSSS